MRGRISGVAGVVTLVVASACGDSGDVPAIEFSPGFTVRDSAGVRIVESSGPRLEQGWSLSSTPVVEIAVDAPAVEEVPLDPVSVFEGAGRTIVVGDGNMAGWDAVLVYDSLGSFLQRMGGSGQGPGEFRDALEGVRPFRGDSIIAWDVAGAAIVFGPDGGPGRHMALPNPPILFRFGPMTSRPELLGGFADGRLLTKSTARLERPESDGPMPYRYMLFAMQPDGMAWDTIGTFRSAPGYAVENGLPVALSVHHLSFELPYGNRLLRASSEAYAYRVLNRDGSVEEIVRRAFAPRPVPRTHVDAYVDWALAAGDRAAQQDRVPGGWGPVQRLMARRTLRGRPRAETMPQFSKVLLDSGGNVWMERFRWPEDLSVPLSPSRTVWDVFSVGGEWISEVVVPERFVLHWVSTDRIYGMRIDENEVRHIVVYGLHRAAA